MTAQALRAATLLCCAMPVWCQAAFAIELEFKTVKVEPKSRIDAIAYFGKGVVVAGTRGAPHAGHIHVSKDYGATWRSIGSITGADFITCLCSAGNGVGYLLTGRDVHVWKTADYGETWKDLGRISKATNKRFANAYGMLATRKGSLLVADADETGGHIHRSTDGGATWHDVGRISTHALYRLNEVKDGAIVNGWAGRVYKTTDDGATWKDMGRLADSPLYAIEYLEEDGTALIGTESGNVFTSRDNGETWVDRGVVGAAADDLARLGGPAVLYSTYTGDRSLYLSEDSGASWKKLGGLDTEPGDWLDHFIYIHDEDVRVVVGGTNKGYILYSQIPAKSSRGPQPD